MKLKVNKRKRINSKRFLRKSRRYKKKFSKRLRKKNMKGGSLPLFIVYGKMSCPFTIKALNFLKIKNKANTFYDVENNENSLKLQELKKSGKVPKNYQTVPVILYNNKFIGGMTDLSELNI